jgi:hypothetical protein
VPVSLFDHMIEQRDAPASQLFVENTEIEAALRRRLGIATTLDPLRDARRPPPRSCARVRSRCRGDGAVRGRSAATAERIAVFTDSVAPDANTQFGRPRADQRRDACARASSTGSTRAPAPPWSELGTPPRSRKARGGHRVDRLRARGTWWRTFTSRK